VGYDFVTFGRNGVSQCSAMVDANGAVVGMGYRNPYTGTTGGGQYRATQIGRTVDNMAPMNTWHYWEFRVTAGSMAVQRDGTPIASWNDASIHAPYDTVYLGKISGQDAGYGNFAVWRYDYDDFYLLDTILPEPVDFLGDVQITTIWPRAAGSTAGWTPVPDDHPNWLTVADKPTPDLDGSYITTTGAASDSYLMEPVHGKGRIEGAQYTYFCRNGGSAQGKLATVTRKGGATAIPTDLAFRPTPDYLIHTVQYAKNPVTNSLWVPEDFNDPGSEHGVIFNP
jgi:hypothetical protein